MTGVTALARSMVSRRCLRQPPTSDLAGIHQVSDGAGEVFDGCLGIDPVLVVEVDVIGPQSAQRAVDRVTDIAGEQHPASRLPSYGIDVLCVLGGDDDRLAHRLQRLSDELFVGVRSVDLRGIEEGHASVHGRADHVDHLSPVGVAAVAAGHTHASEPDS